MDDTLQRLLDAEMRAEEVARNAERERDLLIQGAIHEAHAEEERFERRIPELHAAFLEKADSRADQTIKELRRRYDERHRAVRDIAAEKEEDALEVAFQLLISPESPPRHQPV